MASRIYSLAFLLTLLAGISSQAQTGRRLRVLFIGNSYTYYNDMPGLTRQIATSMGDTLQTAASTPGGWTLQQHFTTPATLALIRQGGWDRVVLQEQSQLPSFGLGQVQAQFFEAGHLLDSTIKEYNPQARTYFYITWGRRDGDASNCAFLPWVCTYAGMDSALRVRYELMADQVGAALSPVGPVWRRLRRTYPALNLYNADASHPSLAGSYASACTMYATLFAKSPRSIPFTSGLPAADADSIRKAVTIVAYDSLVYWRVSTVTGTGPVAQASFDFYPQPAGNWVFLPVPTAPLPNGELVLVDALGRQRILPYADNRADLSGLPPGVYFVRTRKGGWRRLVKE